MDALAVLLSRQPIVDLATDRHDDRMDYRRTVKFTQQKKANAAPKRAK